MQWRTITTGLGNTAYALWNNGHKLLTLVHNHHKEDSVYLESEEGEKRLFKYLKKGLFKNKVVLENEYGIPLGKIHTDGNRKYIVIDNTRFYFTYKNKNEVEIVNEETQQPLAVCSLDVENPNEKTSNSLLMVLCLYLLGQPRQKYSTPALAV